MSPAAGGATPEQSAAAAAAVVAPAIAGQGPDRAAARRDPQGPADGADPSNAAARKTVWGARAPSPTAASAAAVASPVIGGHASWPALAESKPGSSKSSFDSKSLSDGSGPSVQEDSIAASVPSHLVVETQPISAGSNPTATRPPNAIAAASSQQNGGTTQMHPVQRSGSNSGNNGGSRGNSSSGSRSAANSSGAGGRSGSVGDDNWNSGNLGSGSSCNSSNGNGGSSGNENVPGSGSSRNGHDRNRVPLGNDNWNSNLRGNGNGDGYGSGSHWNNNSRHSNVTSNGGRGRGHRGRRDHERGGNFSPRNYPRFPGMQYQQQQQQQPGIYQPGPFPRPLPDPQFMVPQHFMPYVPPFAYHGDVQSYPLYIPPVEQFQNMNLVRSPMQPSWVPHHQLNLQDQIRMQIEFYFSTNNLCHDTYLRRHMNDQGWVPIDLILGFNRMRAFTDLVDTNYIIDAIRGSESLEVQGNNIRRRNDWADWLLH